MVVLLLVIAEKCVRLKIYMIFLQLWTIFPVLNLIQFSSFDNKGLQPLVLRDLQFIRFCCKKSLIRGLRRLSKWHEYNGLIFSKRNFLYNKTNTSHAHTRTRIYTQICTHGSFYRKCNTIVTAINKETSFNSCYTYYFKYVSCWAKLTSRDFLA